MKCTFVIFILVSLLSASCVSSTPKLKSEQFSVQYTAASVPWLAGLFNCAGDNVISAEQRGGDFLDLQSANIVIRLGMPDNPTDFAYQIGNDDILVIVNLKNPTSQLTVDQAYRLFSGQIQNWKSLNGTDAPVQAWVFPTGEDIQEIFNQTVLQGSPVASAAHLAANPDEMLRSIQKDDNAIGIITRRWKTGKVASVFTAATSLPVLAITQSKPQGSLAQILGCMQK